MISDCTNSYNSGGMDLYQVAYLIIKNIPNQYKTWFNPYHDKVLFHPVYTPYWLVYLDIFKTWFSIRSLKSLNGYEFIC